MSSQLLLLVDLDQCLPLTRLRAGHPEDEALLQGHCADLRRACLRLLASRCRRAASAAEEDVRGGPAPFRHLPRFAFRFYSSTGFFSVGGAGGEEGGAGGASGVFQEFGEDSYDSLCAEVGERFERLLEAGKTNSFDGSALERHLASEGRKCPAEALRKVLDNVALLYDWDTPNLSSPVKRRRLQGSQGPENVICVFTRLPEDEGGLRRFFNKRVKCNSRDVFNELFMDKQAKNITSLLKTGDPEVGLNIVDTGCLFGPGGDDGSASKVKSAFAKCLRGVRGMITPFSEILGGDAATDPIVAPWHVPDPQPFRDYAKRIAERGEWTVPLPSGQSKLLHMLQKHYAASKRASNPFASSVASAPLVAGSESSFASRKRKSRGSQDDGDVSVVADSLPPERKIPRRISDESVVSRSSRRSAGGAGGGSGVMKKGGSGDGSRAARLVRLSSCHLESRRLEEAERREAEAACVARRHEEDREKFKEMFEKRLEAAGDLDDEVIFELGKLQADAIKTASSDNHLVLLAEATVHTVLERMKKAYTKSPKKTWKKTEDVLEEYFLTDPRIINGRKYSADCKIRDFKLQVLYRTEMNWLLDSTPRQKEVQGEMLTHLRQISFSASPSEMQKFLQETLVPTYVNPQPDLLCLLYDELNIPRCRDLLNVFSPVKSVAPRSMAPLSNKSTASGFASLGAPAAIEDVSFLGNVAQTQQDKLDKLRRRMMGPQLQIPLQSKKDKGKNVRAITASRIKMKRFPRRSERKTSTSAATASTSAAAAGSSSAGASKSKSSASASASIRGAKRNLDFDSISSAASKDKDRGERKRAAITTLFTPSKRRLETPKKKKGHESSAKRRLTPGKSHELFVPETPNLKGEKGKADAKKDRRHHSRGDSHQHPKRRKTDGTTTVFESPDLASVKYPSRKTDGERAAAVNLTIAAEAPSPRTLRARDALRRKTFYADNVATSSRSILRTEENMRSAKFLNSSLPVTAPSEEGNGEDDGRRRSSAQLLFPHLKPSASLIMGKVQAAQQAQQARSPKKSAVAAENPSGSAKKQMMAGSPVVPLPVPNLATPRKSASDVTPGKQVLFSPGRKVAFDMNEQPPAPKSSGKKSASKSILKSKEKQPPSSSGGEAVRAKVSLFASPSKSPSGRSFLSPTKSVRTIDLRKSPRRKSDNAKKSSPTKEEQLTRRVRSSPRKSPSKQPPTILDEEDSSSDEEIVFSTQPAAARYSRSPEKDQDGDKDQEDLLELRTLETEDVAHHQQQEASTTPSRPSRTKQVVARFGIDDVQLAAIVSPSRSSSAVRCKEMPEMPSGESPSRGSDIPAEDGSGSEAEEEEEEEEIPPPDTENLEREGEEAEEDGGDLRTPTRPLRSRHIVNRFGIDDVTLAEMVSPSARSWTASPNTTAVMAAGNSSPRISLNRIPTPKSSGKKLRSKARRNLAKRNSSLSKIKTVLNEDVDAFIVNLRDYNRKRGRKHSLNSSLNRSLGESFQQEELSFQEEEGSSKAVSPDEGGRYWRVKTLVDTPDGKLKMSLQRKRKPQQQQRQQQDKKLMASDQRLSRAAVNEIGISPDKIKRIMLGSPVVRKSRSRGGAVYASPVAGGSSSVHSSNLRSPNRYSPLTPVGLYNLTKSPLVQQQEETKKRATRTSSGSRKKLNYTE